MSNATASVAPVPIYFESSWSILSSLSLVNVLIGLLVIGITSLSPVTLVPIVVSAAAAVADGICYYAFYQHYSKTNTAVASVFADLLWGVQEAGLSFYSYIILNRILHGKSRRTFIALYWSGIFVVFTFKFAITVLRVKDILNENIANVFLIDRMHIGYFVGIALVEMLSSYFLLRKFFTAQKSSTQLQSHVGLFSYLMRSTEIRLGILTIIGITRSITYSFQTTAQSATNIAGQVDRFVVVLECMFPIVMFIDILSAKSFSSNGNSDHMSPHGIHSSKGRSAAAHITRSNRGGHTDGASGVYSMNDMETRVKGQGPIHGRTSSQELMVDKDGNESELNGKGGINKTVEFHMFNEANSAHSTV